MILAAGLGTRMRPLTNTIPKALVEVNGVKLIDHSIGQLRKYGIAEIVINLGYRGDCIRSHLGDGSRHGVSITYTEENADHLLGSGGGVKNALSFLGKGVFLLCSADIWTDYALENLIKQKHARRNHILLVNNPNYHPQGDFYLNQHGQVISSKINNVTYAGIGVFCPSYFSEIDDHIFSLGRVIKKSIGEGVCFGEKITIGVYRNLGTPEDIAQLTSELSLQSSKPV